jgi:hypothetical protein
MGGGRNTAERGRGRGSRWLVASAGRGGDASDLGDCLAAGPGVAHGGVRVAVAGLGHDELQRELLLAKVGGGRVAELVGIEPGVPLEKDSGALMGSS